MSESANQLGKLISAISENHPDLADMNAVAKPREPHGSEIRHYEPAKLSPLHEEILRRLSLGLTRKEVSAGLGCTTAVVTYVKYSQAGQLKLKELGLTRDQMTVALEKRVSDLGPLAADVIEDVLQDEDASIAIKARTALDVLQMNGISKAPQENANKHLTDSIIESIKNDANASGLMVFASDEVEDALIVEDNTSIEDDETATVANEETQEDSQV